MTEAAELETATPPAGERDPDNGDNGDQDDAQPPDDDDELVTDTGEPTEDQLRSLDDENRRHERRLHEIMGAFVDDFVPCEPCAGSGLVPPGPTLRPHENFKACATCAGFGQIATGSVRGGQELADCPRCAGRGYLQRLDQQGGALGAGLVSPSAPATPPAGELEPAEHTAGQNGEPAEAWGVPSWMGDPNLRPV